MKTVKKLTAIFLCFVMLLGVSITSASAIEIGDTVEFIEEYWDGNSDTYYYVYAGMAKEGINKVESEESYFDFCYEFNAEKAGYYSVTNLCSDDISLYFAETYENGIAKNDAFWFWNDYTDDYGNCYESKVYYLEEGVSLLRVYLYGSYNPSFKIEYYAESISDIDFVNDGEIINVYEDYDRIDTDEKTIYIDIDGTVVFSNGKEIDDYGFRCSYENALVPGENAAKAILPGFEKEITINYCKTTDFVKSVDFGNADSHLAVKEYYGGLDGKYEIPYYGDEKVTVYFNDGTNSTIENFEFDICYECSHNNYVTFPGGRIVPVYVNHDEDEDGKIILRGRVADTVYYEKECTVEKASFKENSERLKSDIGRRIDLMDFDWWISKFLSTGNPNYLQYLMNDIKYQIPKIFDEISTFIRYYL